MSVAQLLKLIVELLHKIADHLANIKRQRKEDDYQDDVEIIEDDPITYANDRYGKLRKHENEQDSVRSGDGEAG